MRVRSKLSIGSMTVTIGLMGCVSVQPRYENGISYVSRYVVGDATAQTQTDSVMLEDGFGAESMVDPMPRKLYWFLAGR